MAQLAKICVNICELDLTGSGFGCGRTQNWLANWTGTMKRLCVTGCTGLMDLAAYSCLANCDQITELSFDGCALRSEGLATMMGDTEHGKKHECGGFPRNIRALHCQGNYFCTDDIFKIWGKYPDVDIDTDGAPGRIIDNVRQVKSQLSLANQNLGADDCRLLKAIVEKYACQDVVLISLAYNPIGNKGLVGHGLLGTLSKLPNVQRLFLTSVGLDDADTDVPLIKELVTVLEDPECFPKLGQLKLDKNKLSDDAKAALRAAWRKAELSEKFWNSDALEL